MIMYCLVLLCVIIAFHDCTLYCPSVCNHSLTTFTTTSAISAYQPLTMRA